MRGPDPIANRTITTEKTGEKAGEKGSTMTRTQDAGTRGATMGTDEAGAAPARTADTAPGEAAAAAGIAASRLLGRRWADLAVSEWATFRTSERPARIEPAKGM